MSPRTLSATTPTLPVPFRTAQARGAGALVVVPDAGSAAVPGWAAQWCRHAGWELRHEPGPGPSAAAVAARPGTRVLVLRPAAGGADGPRVVAAVRRLPDDAPVVADAAACAGRMGARLTVVHAVPRSFAERSVGLAGAVTDGQRLLEAAAERAAAGEPGVAVDRQLLRVRPYELVGEALDADLLVVGGTRSGRPGGGPGLVAHSALHHAPCPVLLTPR